MYHHRQSTFLCDRELRAKRDPLLPQTVSMIEAGFSGFELANWLAIVGPANIPKDIVARLNSEMVKVIQSPEFKKRMDEIGAEPVGNSAAEMAAQIRAETEKFAKLVKDGKVTID